MAITYLKKADRLSTDDAGDVRATVQAILDEIEAGGDVAARKYAEKFDKYQGNIVLTRDEIDAAAAQVPEKLKDDIRFAHDNVYRFAEAQKSTIQDFEFEITPGLIAGQKAIPCQAAGCYAPGGRYAHIASALMTVTTAKVAGCGHIAACSPPRPGAGNGDGGIHPAIIYTADYCGADQILALGGVQGIAAMAFGLFGLPKSDILVGPGNQFVAEAKRILFGRVGIDMFAGPTDSLILADSTADAEIVAVDLVSQAEHGYNSPVWLATTDKVLAETVMARVPELIADLPELNSKNAEAAWRDYAEVILCDTREEVAITSDKIAPEHLTVMADDLDWWLSRLECYGSLFLGEETTVSYGDKASGTNHVLPTSGAAKYTGGLSVHKYMKLVTWQRSTREASKRVAEATARISRLEGMEGHARAADVRLAKYFPARTSTFPLKTDDIRLRTPPRLRRIYMSIDKRIVDDFVANGVEFVTTVPCKQLAGVIDELDQREDVFHIPSNKEDEGMGLCAGAFMGGKRPAIIMQNTAIGVTINTLATLIQYYRMPLPMLISYRGELREPVACQVEMAVHTKALLAQMNIPTYHFHWQKDVEELDNILKYTFMCNKPVAILTDANFWGGYGDQ